MCSLYTGQWVIFIGSVQCVVYILDSGLYSLGVYNVWWIVFIGSVQCVVYILDSGLYSLGVYNVCFIYWTVGCIHWECIMCALYTGQWVVFIRSV